MISLESMLEISKSDMPEAAKTLNQDELTQLVEWLSLKDDNIRYQAFLLLQSRSAGFEDVYPFWENFRDKLKSDNSYQRSIGLMLIAENTKWDAQNHMEDTIDEYLTLLHDEKPITIRQCIQSLGKVVPFKPGLNQKIVGSLLSFDITAVKETMRKSILLDILNLLLIIREDLKTDDIESYILDALSGGILDQRSKKQIELTLREQ